MRTNRQTIGRARRVSAIGATWSVLATMVTFSSAQAIEDVDGLGEPGSIEIHIDAMPDDPQDFAVAVDGGLQPSEVTLDDDGEVGAVPAMQEWTGVGPGSYSVEVSPVPGWDIVGACDDPTGDSGDGSNQVTVEVDADERVVCTFTAVPQAGTIVIINDTVPDDPFDFTYRTSGGLPLNSFALDDDRDPTLSNTQTFTGIAPGAYAIQQDASPFNTSVRCVGTDGESRDLSTDLAIDLGPGETIACTFTNEPSARILLDVEVTPSGESFELLDPAGPLTLASLTDGATVDLDGLSVGPFLVEFEIRAGWDTSVDCVDPDGGTPANTAGGELTVDLDAAETIECTVIYAAAPAPPPAPPAPPTTGTITVIQNTIPDGPQDFTYSISGGLTPPSFSLQDGQTQTFLDVPADAYVIEQAPVAGWSTRVRCVDDEGRPTSGANSARIDLDALETIMCTFTSTKESTITIVTDAQPNDPQDFRFSSTLDFDFFLDDDDDATLPNSKTYTVPPGQWIVTEKATDGWTVRVECSDADGTEVRGSTATIELDVGEDITCTFINTKIVEPPALGTIVIVKRTLPAGSDRQFTITGADGLGSVMLRDGESATFGELEPGSYTFNETLLEDFTVDDITCVDPDGGSVSDPASGGVTVDLDAGETVTCTFTNELAPAPPPPPPPPPPPCVDINQRLRAPGWTPTETTTVVAAIPAGTYSVEVSASDGHHRSGFQTDQVEEQFVIDLYDTSGALVFTTAPNTDLADDATSLTQVVNSGVALPEIGSLRARHVGSGATPDSIDVLCVRFIPG